MSLISSIGSLQNTLLNRIPGVTRTDSPTAPISAPGTTGTTGVGGTAAPGQAFGKVFEQIVSTVDAKENQAQATTRDVLMGNNGQLHQSMIAMQEASVAFQLMIEVRNKVVDSYQELMRMPV